MSLLGLFILLRSLKIFLKMCIEDVLLRLLSVDVKKKFCGFPFFCRARPRWDAAPDEKLPPPPLGVYCSFKTVHNALRCPTSNAMYLPAGVVK